MRWKEMRLTGWGRARQAEMAVARPERLGEMRAAAGEIRPGGLIARGLGRSYGDAALNHGGAGVLSERLDRLLAFDAASGVVTCEAGVSFATLMEVFLPRGWLVPVTPGTAFATIGGAIANDVHGKNHDGAGSFGDHLLWFDLLVASGEVVRVAPATEPDLFRATIGGIGLTGVILAAAFPLVRVPSTHLAVREQRIGDVDHFLAAFAACRDSAPYSVGWIDALSPGGRGILETASFAPTAGAPAGRRARRVPFDLPGFVLGRASVALFNQAYYSRVPRGGRDRLLAAPTFFYPLDSLLDWNRIYGRRGFHQFQCVLPEATASAGIPRLLDAIRASRAASFLAVLKTLGGEGRGDLSFPLRGYTLALDFPHRPGCEALLQRLERITLDHGGRIYLAKDALMAPASFDRMYPRAEHLREVLARIDPAGRFTSDMARRLGLREVQQ